LPAGLTISSSTGTISGTPTGTPGTATVVVKITDAAGGVITKSLSLVVAAQPTITSVTLTNGTGTAGTIDTGDKVTIVYSAQMSVSTFCSSWTGDTTNQSLVANNDVTVSIANGNPDSLSASSAACPTFNFGSISLGSASYVSAATTFKGGTAISTIVWTAGTHTLVITLGTRATGGVSNVTSSIPIYTALSTLRDSLGGSLGNSPLTLASAKQF